MIRSKGEAGTGNIVEAVRHMREIVGGIRRLGTLAPSELPPRPRTCGRPRARREVAETGKLPVVLFCAGGIATPADAALMMQLGAEGNFVGSGIFKSEDPERSARAIVEATTHYKDAERVAAASRGLGRPMRGDRDRELAAQGDRCSPRGWVGKANPLLPPREEAQPLESACWPSRATSRRTRECWRRGAAPGRSPHARRPRRPRRAGHPGRRVDHDHARRSSATASSRCACASRLRAADPRHLRRDDPARPRAPGAARHRRRAQRLRPSARHRSRPTSRSPDRAARADPRGLHPRPVDLQPWARRRGPGRGRRAPRGGP